MTYTTYNIDNLPTPTEEVKTAIAARIKATKGTLGSELRKNIEAPKSKKQSAFEIAVAICQDIKQLKESK